MNGRTSLVLKRQRQATTTTRMSGAKGFGYGSGTQKVQSIPKGFEKVEDLSTMETRSSKAVVVGTLNMILFNVEGQIYCTEANSTAYKYPLIDGKITKNETGQLVIETPLDGTTYDLETGSVIEWCPKNNLIRNFLGGLKEKEKPIPLKVFPVLIDSDGAIYTSRKTK